MHLNMFLQRTSNLFAENRLLKFVVVITAITQIWCVFKIDDIKDRIRTVIQPPVINSKIEISGSWTSESYAKEYIRYIGSLLWNYSPATARNQFAELLVSWEPSGFNDARIKLYTLADQIEKTGAASVFYINKIEIDPDKHIITVTGNRHLSMQDRTVDVAVKAYDVTYVVENGRFWITGVQEKEPAGPGVSNDSTQKNTKPQYSPQGLLEVSPNAK